MQLYCIANVNWYGFMNISDVQLNNYNHKTAFQSKIKMVNYNEFKSMTDCLNKKKHEVGYPWTPETMKKGKNLFTTRLLDCIAVAIVNGKNTKLAHLCTRNKQEAIETSQKEFNIAEIERRLMDGINPKDENIHGFIFGGFNFGGKERNNYRQVRLVEQLFQKYGIPYTAVCGRKEAPLMGRFGIFYKNKDDTFYISHTLKNFPESDYNPLKVKKYLEDLFCKVEISDFDKIV